MNAKQLLEYLDRQTRSIEDLIDQLDEIQVAFNAQFDDFKSRHDTELDRLTDQIARQLQDLSPGLRAAIDDRIPIEQRQLEERRQSVEEEYLPKRQQAADELLNRAQAELAKLRALNPELDRQEEELKAEKAELESRLVELNEEIRRRSRGFGTALHFRAITKFDRERHQVIGKLEMVNKSLYKVRHEWETQHQDMLASQAKLQERWQLEAIAVARLQSELDQLNNRAVRDDLALRRTIRHVLDALKEPQNTSDPELEASLQEMVELNIYSDTYHEGLASVGGMIGLLRGVDNGMQAIRQSVQGLHDEQRMHSAYLKPLSFELPVRVESFHKQWSELAQRFADEEQIGHHPAEFSAAVKPLLEGSLSEPSIAGMFEELGRMLKQATAAW
jgi:DNA repair exonuclease SbcCD ATPase subunit